MSHGTARRIVSAYCLLFASSCAVSSAGEPEVEVLSQSLEDGCVDVAAQVTGDVLAVLSSTDPLDPTVPQAYGSSECAGVVFEFDNPEEEPLHGAWLQASGVSQDEADVLSKGRCPMRELRADYWGYKDKTWTQLAAAQASASFVSDTAYCALDALLTQEGTYEKLRIVARVEQDTHTYPMFALLW